MFLQCSHNNVHQCSQECVQPAVSNALWFLTAAVSGHKTCASARNSPIYQSTSTTVPYSVTQTIHEQQVHKNATTYHLLLPNHHLGSHWPVTCFMHLNSISINHFSLDDSSDKLTTSISLSQLPSFPFKYTIAWINGRTDGFRFPFPRTAGLPRFA